MKPPIPFPLRQINKFIETALEEDIGNGDITTNAIISDKETSTGRVIAKQNLIVCGLEIFKHTFSFLDKSVNINLITSDGEEVKSGDVLLTFSGHARPLLSGERLSLNILQRLSGIAALTSKFVKKVPKSVIILDTRKTTPGMRIMEKYAVRCGGGSNHRFGLYDAVLIKDNHINAVGSITKAVKKIRKNVSNEIKIEVEVTDMAQVKEALLMESDILLLDNMTPDKIREAALIINNKAKIEVSGNIGLHNVEEIANTGIDFISIGALTHSAPSVDISMIFD